MSRYLAQARARGLDLDPVNRKNLETIDRHGWTVIGVFDPDGGDPPFVYTIGAHLASGGRCPELVVVGLEIRQGNVLLNSIVEQARDEGLVVGPGFNADVLGEDYLAYFGEVIATLVLERFPRGAWFANAFEPDVPYRVLQLVWPDKERRFPWDLDPDARKAAGALPRQPLLCLPPFGAARA